MRPRSIVPLLLGLALLVPVAAADAKQKPAKRPAKVRLAAFRSCTDLVGYARRQALRTHGLSGVPVRAIGDPAVSIAPAPTARTNAGAAPPAAAPLAAEQVQDTQSFSGTNNQEAAVDESDIVKTDGKTAYIVYGDKLLAIDVTADAPRLVGSLKLEGTIQEILLRGDRLLAIGSQPVAPDPVPVPLPEPLPGPVPLPPVAVSSSIAYQPAGVRLTEIDIGKPASMTVSRTLDVDGSYVSARLTGGTARVVLNTPPQIVQESDTPPVVDRTTSVTSAIADKTIRRAGVRAFVPRTVLRSHISKRTFRRSLVGCHQVRRPTAFSGLDLLTVLTIDLDRGLFNVDRDAVMAGAQVVYASAGSLYVASQRFIAGFDAPADIPSSMRTEIHRFDTSAAAQTTYRSSGTVSGFVLNQYAMSEDRGDLRVASTEEPLWLNGAPQRDSESAVAVLREREGRLVQIGRVGGLGRGERIYAARFIGDRGYLVTFRQVDPLYTLDLSDPTSPKLAGELKITGYSAYLHPIGDDLLLGVGRDATEEGRLLGAQVSVFDVSDAANPKRLHQRALGGAGSSSQAEFDPHAFLWWEPTRLAMLPLQEYADGKQFAGAVGVRVGKAEGIEEIRRVTHDSEPYPAAVLRSMVVGKRVFTVSERGIAASALADLAPLGFLAFPAAEVTPGPVPAVR